MKKETTWKKLVVLVLTACMIMTFAGCGGDSASKDKTDTLNVALSGDILAIDPQQTGGTPTETIKAHVFDTLVTLNSDGTFSPNLATEWDVSEDGTEWTFKLREGVKFHDGSDFTADDVVRTYTRLINNEYGANRVGDFPNFLGAEKVDEYTVVLKTDGPVGNFLNLLSYGGGAIMSADAIDTFKDDIGKSLLAPDHIK